MRIWHQSITDLQQLPGYATMLSEHASRICDSDTIVDIHGVSPGTYPEGVAPIEASRYPWLRYLLNAQIVENAVRAEKEGYDAVAISCFLDPGLEEARSLVDIPVVSICEATLLVGRSIGHSFGLIGLEQENAAFLRRLVHHYGFGEQLADVVALDPPVKEPELDRAFTGSSELVDRFEDACQRTILAGADVLIPAEGVLNEVLVNNGVREVCGLVVMDAYAVVLTYAEMLVQLRRKTDLKVSRGPSYARPDEELVNHFRGVTRTILENRPAQSPMG